MNQVQQTPTAERSDAAAAVFVFAGGGTGGHIYPGIAIAEALRRARPGVRCVFVCSNRPLDAKILTEERQEFTVSPAMPLAVRPRGLLKFLSSWGPSVRQTRQLLSTLGPGARVVAMGGFVAAPSVQAARAMRRPVTLVNLDAIPGKANRWIARHAERVFSTSTIRAERPERFGAWRVVPPIVREKARWVADPTVEVASGGAAKSSARAALGLDPERPVLMVTGGSQGARSLNAFVAAFFEAAPHASLARQWQVLHQTGKGEAEAVRAAYERAGVRALVLEFVSPMSPWWGAADLCVARAGAGNVAEAWANAVPTLFLPYPYHRDEHQRFNALTLVEAGACRMVKDLIDPVANLTSAGAELERFMAPESLASARAAFRSLGPADGAEQIARALLDG